MFSIRPWRRLHFSQAKSPICQWSRIFGAGASNTRLTGELTDPRLRYLKSVESAPLNPTLVRMFRRPVVYGS